VSRMRYISSRTQQNVRLVGLSTALANCQDLGDWLGVSKKGLYNFRPSVRPVRLEVHIAGFPGKHYCPRMVSFGAIFWRTSFAILILALFVVGDHEPTDLRGYPSTFK